MKRCLWILLACTVFVLGLCACDDGSGTAVTACMESCDRLSECDEGDVLLGGSLENCREYCQSEIEPETIELQEEYDACNSEDSCEALHGCLLLGRCKLYCYSLQECDETETITNADVVVCKDACHSAAGPGGLALNEDLIACGNKDSCKTFYECLYSEPSTDH